MNKPQKKIFANTFAVEAHHDPQIEDDEEKGIAHGCIWRNKEKKRRWIYTGFDYLLDGPRWISIPWEEKEDAELPQKVGADLCVFRGKGKDPFAIIKIDGHVVAHLTLFGYEEPDGKGLLDNLVGAVVGHHFSS